MSSPRLFLVHGPFTFCLQLPFSHSLFPITLASTYTTICLINDNLTLILLLPHNSSLLLLCALELGAGLLVEFANQSWKLLQLEGPRDGGKVENDAYSVFLFLDREDERSVGRVAWVCKGRFVGESYHAGLVLQVLFASLVTLVASSHGVLGVDCPR